MKRLISLCGAALLAGTASAQTLKVGDDAPALSVEKFIKGDPIANLSDDQVYVVEFWATWCPPCITSIPHLSKLQEQYPNIKVIGVASSERGDNPLPNLEGFVEKRGDEMNYTVAFDDDRSMANDWMRPAGQNGIPCAFIVKDGKIAWIGHPMRMDEPLAEAAKTSTPDREFALMVGDKAPSMTISEWTKGDPVTEFRPGHVYVVEFWATWCGPCIAGIPHLTELQHEYKDDVTIIGVNIWEENASEKVPPFVEKKGDVMDYTVAIQDGTSMADNWMSAAGRRGIPSAFIVDQKGYIAWMGHPMQMDEPLADVVAGRLDGQKAAKLDAERRAKAAKAGMTTDQLMQKYVDHMRGGNFKDAFDFAEKNAKVLWDHQQGLNMVAWTMLTEGEADERPIDVALKFAVRANDLAKGEDPAILDTLAKAYWEKGSKDKAISIQEKAVDLSIGTEWEQELKDRLAEYKSDK